MKPFFCRLYNYNIWRHNTLYSKIKEVDKYKKNLEKKFPQQLYFTSIKATFNHLLLGDLLWLNRITKNNEIELHVINQKIKINELSYLWNEENLNNQIFKTDDNKFNIFFDYYEKNEIWFENHIIRQMHTLDEFIKLINHLDEKEFPLNITYTDTQNNLINKKLNDSLFHIINHHTHHIGQISNALLNLSKKDVPSLDYTIKF